MLQNMVPRCTLFKTFNNYTEAFYYMLAVDMEFDSNFVTYVCEVYYRELLNDFKVIYKVYDAGQHEH